ncbi:unnamed protein product [Schistosoma margrebowiei]|uniref:RRM domain-containing protein n=1 Tax=Schistosoma margrebowiei TaxID=48269 RepID=A0AA84Z9N0_9TREM|nr:unnamed protein product [Schistosoma margrebowiei]
MPKYDRQANGYRVFVGGVDPRVGKVDIEQEFERFGPIADVWVARNPPGFAFIVFKYAEDADRAVRRMDGSRPFGSRLRVEHAVNNKTANSRRHDRSRSRSYSKRRRDSPPRRRTPVRRSSSGRRRSPSDFRDTRRHSPPGYERNRSGHEDRYRTRSQSSSKRSSKHKTSRPRSRTPSRQSSHRNSNRHSRSQSRNSHKNNGRHSPTPDRRSVSDYDRSHSRSPDVERRHSYEDSGSPVNEGRNASPGDRGARNHNSRSVSRSRSRSQQSNHRFRSRSPSDYHDDGAPREHSSDSHTGDRSG